ncbi:CYTH domain-containing protein [Schinkia sp. CFF1]
MSQEIEIEYKNMLTKDEFELLMKNFAISPDDFISQENYYFDTFNFSLRAKKSALRIRKREDKYIFTLKQPLEQGLLETHQELTAAEAILLLEDKGKQFVDGDIKDAIMQMRINPLDIHYLGELTTNRAEIKDGENILVLDHSFYQGHEDYELEYEVKKPIEGKERFLEIIKQHHIPLRNTKNKIARFFEIRQQKEDQV